MLSFFREVAELLEPVTLLVLFAATAVGILVGALPGLTATMGIALLTGITYGLSTELALVILMGIYVGAIYGGTFPAIMLNIPGTASSAATTLDGYPLALRGEGAQAKGFATVGSFVGAVFGLLILMTFAPVISGFALRFTSVEYALLALFGIVICGSLTAEDLPLKGWIAGMLGVLISTVGVDPLHGYGRFTFGTAALLTGIAFVPAMIGVFGIPQILRTMKDPHGAREVITESGRVLPRWADFRRMIPLSLRSGAVGTAIGAVPGVGEDIASWSAYGLARRTSRKPELFGKGSYEGVVAAETGNNSAIGGALIPLLTLAVPGSPPTAVLLGALWLHGVRPGPLLATESPDFIHQIGAILLLASVAMLVCGLLLTRVVARLLTVPREMFMPIIAVLCVMGAYALNFNLLDVRVMLGLGLIFYLLTEMKYPAAPLVLGLILGPILDENLRRAISVHDGSLLPFVTRPIALLFLLAIVVSVVAQTSLWARFRGGPRRGGAVIRPPDERENEVGGP
jgi:putative tricarboxylic transport membrane protein